MMRASMPRGRSAEGVVVRAVPLVAAAVGAATVAVGLYVRRATDTPLGVPYPPALGNWAPQADPLLIVSVACLAAAVVLAPRLLEPRVSSWAFALATLVLTLVLRLALAAGRGGSGEWSRVFDLARSAEAKNEYLPALGALDFGARFFLDRFAELVPALPVHVAGHPPGLLLTLHALGIDTPGEMAALCIGIGALSGPLAYLLGRQVLDERGARLAALLLTVAPGALLFGATSADAVYLTLGLAAAWPLATRAWPARAAGAAALALASFFAWSLLAVGAWAAILAWRREGLRAAAALAAMCGVAVAAFYALLYAATGFDPIGTIRATEEVYRSGIASLRPYWYWLFGSPVAFLLVLGLPIAWHAVRGLAAGDALALAIFAVIAVAAVLGLTKAETERIWLFLAPFVCLAAAAAIGPRRPLTAIFAALAVQAVVYELLFDTVW
jgi:methylthioxylose transferase